MAKMVQITCACGCGKKRMVRASDVKRGWGKYISKSHKARHQEAKTGQYKRYLQRNEQATDIHGVPVTHPHSEEAFMP